MRPRPDDELDETLSRRDVQRIARVGVRSDLQRVLGALVVNTTMLPRVNGTMLAAARDHDGRVLSWSVWAPHRAVLIDVFRKRMPPQSELDARTAFAERHALRYAIVEPGKQLTAKSVKEWLDG